MDALVVAAASGGLSLVMAVAARLFLPEYREQRIRRAKHIHDWGPWEYETTIAVYPAGKNSETSYPLSRQYVQRRACTTCQLVEHERSAL